MAGWARLALVASAAASGAGASAGLTELPVAVAVAADADADQRCLTEAVYYEAGFEPRAGQEAVAQVVLNRLHAPGFPKTLCGVVYQRAAAGGGSGGTCQFTFTCDGALSRRRAPAAWEQAAAVARAALAGGAVNPVGDALNYHAWYVAPAWRGRLQLVTRIGAHLFYRQPGGVRPAPAVMPPSPDGVAQPAPFAPWGLALTPAG